MRTTSLRTSMSHSYDEVVVYAMDVLSEPCRELFYQKNPLVQAKCSRALPIAQKDDIVVLSGSLDTAYLDWLHGLGIGPETVVEYNKEYGTASLTEIILDDPQKLRKAIERSGRHPVLIPFYCGDQEVKLASEIDAELFGSPEEITLRYFNKDSFKQECIKLGISVIAGESHSIQQSGGRSALQPSQLADVVSNLLDQYSSLIIRGTQGSAGSSLYTVEKSGIEKTIEKILANKEDQILLEPFLKVISSPNDQWVIDRDGNIHHLGLTAQLFEGLQHTGNLKGRYFSQRITEHIISTSRTIVESMAEANYRGVCGIDYIVSTEGIYPIENNARMNGSSFTIGLVQNLAPRHGEIPCWKFYKAATKPCSFSQLKTQLGELLYDGTYVNAIFPYDCDTLPLNGVFTLVLLAEDMYHIESLEEGVKELGVKQLKS